MKLLLITYVPGGTEAGNNNLVQIHQDLSKVDFRPAFPEVDDFCMKAINLLCVVWKCGLLKEFDGCPNAMNGFLKENREFILRQ